VAENMKKREARIQKAGGVIGGVIGIASIVFAMAVVVFSGVSVKLTGTALELSGGIGDRASIPYTEITGAMFLTREAVPGGPGPEKYPAVPLPMMNSAHTGCTSTTVCAAPLSCGTERMRPLYSTAKQRKRQRKFMKSWHRAQRHNPVRRSPKGPALLRRAFWRSSTLSELFYLPKRKNSVARKPAGERQHSHGTPLRPAVNAVQIQHAGNIDQRSGQHQGGRQAEYRVPFHVAPDGLLFLCGKRRRRRHGLLGGKPVLAEKLQKRKPKQLGDGLEQYNIRIIQSRFP